MFSSKGNKMSDYAKRSIFHVENNTQPGFNNLADGSLIMEIDSNTLYIKQRDTTGSDTLLNAINTKAAIKVWSEKNDRDNVSPQSTDKGLSAVLWGGYKLTNVEITEPPVGTGDIGDIWFQRDA